MKRQYGPPPPLGLSRPSRSDTRYRLDVVQQPVRARCCGFGEKDRRLIDPPPILQLFAENGNGQPVPVTPADSMLFVVQCEIFCEKGHENRMTVLVPSSAPPEQPPSDGISAVFSLHTPKFVRNLLGSLAVNASHLLDHNNCPGVFFIFHDLSVRTEGRFRLKFTFIDLAAGEPLTMSTRIQSDVLSEPFTVYTAKKFPGMAESTALSKAFARQGIKINIRREPSYARTTDKYYSMRRLPELPASASPSSSPLDPTALTLPPPGVRSSPGTVTTATIATMEASIATTAAGGSSSAAIATLQSSVSLQTSHVSSPPKKEEEKDENTTSRRMSIAAFLSPVDP